MKGTPYVRHRTYVPMGRGRTVDRMPRGECTYVVRTPGVRTGQPHVRTKEGVELRESFERDLNRAIDLLEEALNLEDPYAIRGRLEFAVEHLNQAARDTWLMADSRAREMYRAERKEMSRG